MSCFGARLRECRESAGLTQQTLATSLGVRTATLVAWEKGSSAPTLANATQLAEHFGVSLDWLARGRGKRRSAA